MLQFIDLGRRGRLARTAAASGAGWIRDHQDRRGDRRGSRTGSAGIDRPVRVSRAAGFGFVVSCIRDGSGRARRRRSETPVRPGTVDL